ncbi:tripartite tricarboxylate transporter substrate binding protein [Roseomonas sp. M0104]|uniref:Tripartite tricarboxylate transporter substrate binding protein n=2 Tax=Teichococcus coralli TaxID=2545983 RepID=A0A845B9T9_9PROT|nr:tripartite tricarboxylate transporter substrate binding protein [Pseudoroseomonas coralli]
MTIAAFGAVLGLSATLPAAVAAEWKPTKPVEFVVASGPGGGTDNFARTVQAIIGKYDLLPVSVIVSNKGGGSGAEGFVYTKLAGGDTHKLIFGTSNEWLLPLVSKVAWKPEELTPVAAMAFDEFVLWTKADAPYKDAADYVKALKAAPEGKFRMGGAQSKDTDQILTRLIEKGIGARWTYVPFRSGGEAGVQLAGGHIDSNVNNPSESLGAWRGGQVKPLCVFSPERLPEGPAVTEGKGWHDIPTCKEEGIPVAEYRMPRTVFLPPKVSDGVREYYEGVLRRVAETPEWKEFVTRTSQTARFMDAEQLKTFMAKDQKSSTELFREEGWLVN